MVVRHPSNVGKDDKEDGNSNTSEKTQRGIVLSRIRTYDLTLTIQAEETSSTFIF